MHANFRVGFVFKKKLASDFDLKGMELASLVLFGSILEVSVAPM